MRHDVNDFRAFYATPLGQAAGHQIQACIQSLWPNLDGCRVLGFGYALPYLDFYLKPLESVFAFMPAQRGVMVWPDTGQPRVALVEEHSFPLSDESVDRILMIHAIEHAEQVRPLLREAWRILNGNGRLLIIAPNRRSLWASLESSPFGHGEPYTLTQLTTVLRDNLFTPINFKRALYLFPSQSRIMMACAPFLDKVGRQVLQKFSGVICVEAIKQVYVGTLAHERKAARATSLVGA
jgi:SAM-dependent methyltransferase